MENEKKGRSPFLAFFSLLLKCTLDKIIHVTQIISSILAPNAYHAAIIIRNELGSLIKIEYGAYDNRRENIIFQCNFKNIYIRLNGY